MTFIRQPDDPGVPARPAAAPRPTFVSRDEPADVLAARLTAIARSGTPLTVGERAALNEAARRLVSGRADVVVAAITGGGLALMLLWIVGAL